MTVPFAHGLELNTARAKRKRGRTKVLSDKAYCEYRLSYKNRQALRVTPSVRNGILVQWDFKSGATFRKDGTWQFVE